MEKSGERGGERISEWKWRERGWERETRVEHSPVVLAPETRWTQRTVPAPLDDSPQPGGRTNLPPLPGNRRPRAAHTLITVRLCCFANFHVIKRKGKHQRELQGNLSEPLRVSARRALPLLGLDQHTRSPSFQGLIRIICSLIQMKLFITNWFTL